MPFEVPVEKPDRRRILVVDDDPGVRKGLRLILERDYDVNEAESIAQSLTVFDQQKPDLITLDIRMPGVDGMQGLDIFRHRSETIPIILISGYHTFELAQEALRLGATDYLTKPFTAEEIRQTVKTALSKAKHDEDPAGDPAQADFMVRLPVQNLREEDFLSLQHRSHFLAFVQNALSGKERTMETIPVHEFIKTIRIQFRALRLAENVNYAIERPDSKARIECDMYLLGGALANLALTCMVKTRGDKSPVKMVFAEEKEKLQVFYKKSDLQLPEDLRARFEEWRRNRKAILQADVAMLALAEKVAQLHKGEIIFDGAFVSGSLLEISLPLKPPAEPADSNS
jgi:YesN/AraC family two-component response regulator